MIDLMCAEESIVANQIWLSVSQITSTPVNVTYYGITLLGTGLKHVGKKGSDRAF